ncbi:MAG: hypothetical protein OEY52_09550 [Gammaproteobacteria bacterium]|nr:hypothetical protein [Gammaproteobacteria bacterium]
MKRKLMAITSPPLAVCQYGCAGCCAAPIGVFWITGIISIIYGFMGGPANIDGISWMTVLLGLGLWLIAAVWAENTIKGVEADEEDPRCQNNKTSNICRIVSPKLDDSDPLDEVKKFQ